MDRNGDPVRIEAHVSGNTPGKGKAKAKKADEDGTGVEGVVYRVSGRVVQSAWYSAWSLME
jgi:hypothetical protein